MRAAARHATKFLREPTTTIPFGSDFLTAEEEVAIKPWISPFATTSYDIARTRYRRRWSAISGGREFTSTPEDPEVAFQFSHSHIHPRPRRIFQGRFRGRTVESIFS